MPQCEQCGRKLESGYICEDCMSEQVNRAWDAHEAEAQARESEDHSDDSPRNGDRNRY